AIVGVECPGLQVADHHTVGLIEQDSAAIDRRDRPQVGEERGVRPQLGIKDEIDDQVGVPVESAGVVDVKSIQNTVREFVIARAVVGILKSLGAHAHHQAVGATLFVAPENIEVVQVRGLVFEQQRAVAVARGKYRREGQRNDAETKQFLM